MSGVPKIQIKFEYIGVDAGCGNIKPGEVILTKIFSNCIQDKMVNAAIMTSIHYAKVPWLIITMWIISYRLSVGALTGLRTFSFCVLIAINRKMRRHMKNTWNGSKQSILKPSSVAISAPYASAVQLISTPSSRMALA